jgi:hypothetical protein
MTQQLLVEYFPLVYDHRQILTEAANNPNAPIKVKCILQRADAKNQNGRVYPKEILMREAQKYESEFVSQRRALGELDHPESTVVNLRNVSHNIVEVHWEGADLMGTIEVLSTPSGNIVKELMKNGIRLGVSSRGVGSIKDLGENTVEVDDDFGLICFDIVSNPSTHGAFLNESAGAKNAPYLNIEKLVYDFFAELK